MRLAPAAEVADDVSVNFNTSLVRSARLRDADLSVLPGSTEYALRSDRFWTRARLVVDVALVAGAAALADVTSSHVSTFTGQVLWPALFGVVVLYLSYLRGSYARRAQLDTLDDLRATGAAVGIATSVVVTLRVLLDAAPESSASHSVRLGIFAGASIVGGRVAINLWQARTRRQGKALVPTLIVGAGHIGRTAAKRLLDHPELGLKPVGFLDKEPLEQLDDSLRLPVLGASWDFDRIAAEHGLGQVIVTFSTAPSEVLLRIVNRCEELGIAVTLVPRLFEKVTERLTIEHLGGLPLITSHPSNPRGWQFAIKSAVDRAVALVLICLLAPLLVVCALAVWISLGRPILFRQWRVGCDGRLFEMLKFRSLRPNGDHGEALYNLPDDTAPGGVEDDDRLTRVGKFLRNTSLDELPQLLNVLRGEMSLVGPRPERPEFVELFEPRVHRYYDRHRVKAGITGWAQVNGLRGQTSLSDRVEWDNYYIENASLWLDLKIIGRTILALPRHSRTCR
jgi:exopolysaccharide biosynthesis polyprenyl glycosylphosphotransferase